MKSCLLPLAFNMRSIIVYMAVSGYKCINTKQNCVQSVFKETRTTTRKDKGESEVNEGHCV